MKTILKKNFFASILALIVVATTVSFAPAPVKADRIVFWGDNGCTYIIDNPDGTQTGLVGTRGYMNGCNPIQCTPATAQSSIDLLGDNPGGTCNPGGLTKAYAAFNQLFPTAKVSIN